MIWGAAAVIEEAHDGLNMLRMVSARPPAQFLERQMEQIRMTERLLGEEVRLEAIGRGLTVESLLAELHTAKYAIVDLSDLADYQEHLAWDLFEQGVIRRWDDAVRAIPPHGQPGAGEYTGVPDEECSPINSGIFAARPARSPKGLRDLNDS